MKNLVVSIEFRYEGESTPELAMTQRIKQYESETTEDCIIRIADAMCKELHKPRPIWKIA